MSTADLVREQLAQQSQARVAEEKDPTAQPEPDHSPTAGEEIEAVFEGEGLLDQAFAEMMGSIADRVSGQEREPEQTQDNER